MSDGKKENSKHRNHKGKTRADNFSAQMNELKEIVRKELSRGAQIAEVEKKLDGKIDKIVSEVRDYERLEHMISAKATDAVKSVDVRIGIIAVIAAALAFFGWDIVVEKVTESAVSRIGESAAKAEIDRVVSNQVHKAQNEIKATVSNEIEIRVPRMIEKQIEIVNTIARAATENIENVQSKVETMAIVTAARANSRKHFDLLVKLSTDTNKVVEAQIAKDAIKTIEDSYKHRKYGFDSYRPVLKMNNGQKIEIDLLIQLVRADLDWNCDGAIGEIVKLNRKEFVATLVRVVKASKRLDTVYLAINGIEHLTGKTFPPLGIAEVLNWWKEASKEKQYHSQYEWYRDMLERIIGNNTIEKLTNVFLELIDEAKKAREKDPDFKIASKLIVHLVTRFPDYKNMLNDGRQELCKNALKDIEGTPYQDSVWYVNNAYFKYFTESAESFYKYINDRLETNPDFETDLKHSSLFTDAFF